MILTQSQIAGYAKQVGLKGNSITIASAIAMAESSGDTAVINPGTPAIPEYSVGLWQINLRSHPEYTVADMQDPLKNARAMYAISNGGTKWTDWSTYTNGAYLLYMRNTSVTPPSSTSTNTPSQSTGNPEVTTASGSGYTYVLAYTIAIAFFVLLSKTRAGYRAIYYGLLLCLMLLFVTESSFIQKSLAPITQPFVIGAAGEK